MHDGEALTAARAQVSEMRAAHRRREIAEGRPLFPILSLAEMRQIDPDPTYFEIDRREGVIHLFWGGTDYEVDLDEITTPLALLEVIAHVGEKEWELTSGVRLRALIESVCYVKGWDLWGAKGRRSSDAKTERSRMTPQLRWRVFQRDSHTCQSCGSTPAMGALLHVDHVQPLAKGGLTEFDNLQTLCATCNLGKGSDAQR